MRRASRTKKRLRKIVDDADQIRTAAGGLATRREEAWVNERGEVVRSNLAYIDHALCRFDHGRVLGYDNAHGQHERHWMGVVTPVVFTSYAEVVSRFNNELQSLR